MKKIRSLSLKQLSMMTALLLLFTCTTLFLFGYKRDEKNFQSLTSDLFIAEMTSNTLNMHYTVAYPENYGISRYTPTLSFYDAESAQESYSASQKILQSLYDINPEKLSENDQYTYHLLIKTFENNIQLGSYKYYEEPLSPSLGAQSQLPVLLAEYSFRTKKDVEDYLSLLGQTGQYFQSLLTYEQEKKNAGLFMAATSADKVISQCQNIITEKDLDSGTHFLQSTFAERIQLLQSQGVVSDAEANGYLSQNTLLLKTVLLPAYQSLADGIIALKDGTIFVSGLSSKPDGAAYYRLYLAHVTGSYREIDEIRHMLLNSFSAEWDCIKELVRDYPEAAGKYSGYPAYDFPVSDEDSMLDCLNDLIGTDFPEIPAANVTVKPISQSLEKYSAPAFYLTPPIDDYDSNVIYINESLQPDGLELFTTLAHEGYPGHLYQTVYNKNALKTSNENVIRYILWYGGYLEGWAIYSEFLAFDYASEIYKQAGNTDLAVMTQLRKHNRSLQLCLYSLLDIMINYENATESQIAEVLAGFGITSPESVSAVYSYIAEEPCNYLKYYLGYLELLSLRETAKELWGDQYTDYGFHKFYLESGPSDFASLNEKMEKRN